jgi:hypothetical protein
MHERATCVPVPRVALGAVRNRPQRAARASSAADVLRVMPMDLKKLRASIKEDTGETHTEDALRMTLKRYPKRFSVDKVDSVCAARTACMRARFRH